jgi:acetylornithine deacetylase/succinyl-diaminopimelate desuccinylase-like protein
MRIVPIGLPAALSLLPLTPAGALPVSAGDRAAVDKAARASLPEWVEFLKLPNITRRSTAEIRKNAEWAEAAFRRHGFAARQLEDGETPMVFAEWPGASPGRKTVLFYAHMDGQGIDPKEWDQPDPFAPTLKQKKADGGWEVLPIARLSEANPDWRLFARSAADDKAPIMMLMAAMDALRAQGRAPVVNVKIILDSHEEGGPPTLRDVVTRNAALLKADAVAMLDGPQHISNRPTIVFGHRSGAMMTITVFGPRGEMHSGHYGNFVPNPAQELATLIAGFKDADGRVLIPGFYDGVAFSPAMKKALAAVPDDEAEIRARAGVAANDRVGDNYQESLNYPSLNILAMKAADVDNRRTIIPATATAMFDIRTVPATPGERQIALVRTFVQSKGWHLVNGTPTEAERRAYPKLVSISGGDGGAALSTPLDSPVGQWARKALLGAFGEEPVRIPMMGGSVPTEPLVEGLKVPVLLIPLVNADNNQHAANENMRLGNYFDGVRSLYALFSQPY